MHVGKKRDQTKNGYDLELQLLRLCAMRSGRLCSFQYRVPTEKMVATRKMPITTMRVSAPSAPGTKKGA